MEYRQLGGCGLRVPVLSFGTATFGGVGEFYNTLGTIDVPEAKRLVGICLDAGVNFFDTANIYSKGRSEEILGAALKGQRDKAFISTKATFPTGATPNDYGSSRYGLLRSCEASLRRLDTDYVDLFYVHGFDATTPIEETLRTLDELVRSGKIRYIGCSNFSGWHLMKSLSISERHGLCRYVVYQGYYSLASREYEWELMPLALDQRVGTVVWSPLAGAALSGKVGRNKPAPPESRLGKGDLFARMRSDRLYDIIDALEEIASETGKSVPQIALNWVMRRPSVVSIVMGARNEEQLKHNLDAVGWALSDEHVRKLDAVSETQAIYPYWNQHRFTPINPPPVAVGIARPWRN